MKWHKKLLYWGFCRNFWGWFHAFAGAVIAKFSNILISAIWSIVVVLIVATIWELYEFYGECKGDFKIVEKIYGSVEKYWYDTAGDILLAVIFAAIVVL